jgi:GTPase SAR1 family protein
MIDKTIKADAKKNTEKILLLGTGESGKSTFAKQLKLLHAGGFTKEERVAYKRIIQQHVVYSIDQLKSHMEENGEVGLSRQNKEILASFSEELELTPETATKIKSIYEDPAFKELAKQKTFHNLDNTQHFLAQIDRIAQPSYEPSDDDCLQCRSATTGVQEMTINIEGHDFLVVDVGGQRSERRKWAHCFENVDAIIYLVSLSEYDQTLFEDGVTNRMQESMSLFDQICNMQWFMHTSLILFLNKKDLFEKKIKTTNITTAFSDYKGAQEYEPAVQFIQAKYLEINKNPERKVAPHVTCATDTENIRVVFQAVKATILNSALKASGLC